MENNTQQNNAGVDKQERSINIRDLVFMVINNWYWFGASVVACLVIAGFVYKAQPKTYTATGTILVRDNNNSNSYSRRNMDAILSNMGMDNSNLSLENEIYMLRSSSLMSQVVSRLGLQYYCNRNDAFRKVTYFRDAPIALTVHDLVEDREPVIGLKVKPLNNGKYEYSAITRFKEKYKGEAAFGQTINLDDTLFFSIDTTAFFNA